MASTEEDAQQKVAELVAKLQGLSAAQARDYNEANTINGFVRPLFEALGWDFADLSQVEAERTVGHGRADFILKVRGVARLVLEIKALRHSLLGDRESAKQAINYAYNKGLNWAVLTNFDSLQLFNAQRETQDPVEVRFLALDHKRFLSDFGDLWLLSHRSVGGSSLDKAGEKYGHLNTRTPIDKHLYDQLRAWRERLFNEIYLHHKDKGVTETQADVLVQQFFNRLIFIRAAEDRRLTDNELRAMLHQWATTGRKGELVLSLRRVFRQFHNIYDSELFPILDTWDSIWLGRDTIADVVNGLYDLRGGMTAYDFSIIGPDVLGRVYEQYLGWVAETVRQRTRKAGEQLRLLPGDADYQIVEKKEKRKRGGIYYTPEWVVDYIIGQTVGCFVRERRHDEILDVKVLDPACGSGSFLIKAYDELLRYHARHQGISETLSFADRMPLLKNNIFGLDLDPQAVEIARLNLLLSALAQPEALPKLANNIRWGNALISGGETELTPYFGDGWEQKRPFDWQREFPDIMARGGFDIVIGNPPYVETALIPPKERDYYRANLRAAHGLFDLYTLFLEQGLRLLKGGGVLGFITSGKFLRTQYGEKLCDLLARETTIDCLVDLSDQKQVFGKATNYPCIIVFRKRKEPTAFRFAAVPAEPTVDSVTMLKDTVERLGHDADQASLSKGIWPPPRGVAAALMEKMVSIATKLGDIAEIYHGLQTNADPVFILERRGGAESGVRQVHSPATGRRHELEEALLHPLLKGSVHMRRYGVDATNLLLLLPYYPASAELLPPKVIQQLYPRTWEYLNLPLVKERLQSREGVRWRNHPHWYGYTRRNNHDKFGMGKPRLMTPSLAPFASFSYDAQGAFFFVGSGGGGGGGYGIELGPDIVCSLLYLLALLNSLLLDYYLHHISSPFRGGYRAYNRQYIARLPIRLVDFANPHEKQMYDALVARVDRMLDLHQRLAQKGGIRDHEREDLERAMERTDQDIDGLVYDLYGLTAEERALVEASRGIRRQ